MKTPQELKYTPTHEWIRVEGNRVYVGITDHAQESLGEIVFVELPVTGDTYDKTDEVTTVESVKAASAIYAPVSGTITEVNSILEETPDLLNKKPWDTYIFALEISDSAELDDLLSPEDYAAVLESEE